MTVKQIDILNIGLMLLSAAIAFVVPFELFLFSYAVLGPLHYLTEIGWLHKRQYFSTGKYDFIWLGFLCLVLCSFTFIFTEVPAQSHAFILFLAFASALAMILFNNFLYKVIIISVAMFVGFAVQQVSVFFILFAILLPTIIHVFVFTGLFIIQGALKNKSITGFLSVIIFVACAISFFVWQPEFKFYSITEYAKQNLVATNFHFVNQYLMYYTGFANPTLDKVFGTAAGYSVMRLIAFAYTYHYLNWFSKTTVIKWHDIPVKWLAGIFAAWVLSVLLYVYDYKTGLQALLFLSMLHVFLEFPLNFRSVQGIFQSVSGLLQNSKSS
jgi:hypothetical protein